MKKKRRIRKSEKVYHRNSKNDWETPDALVKVAEKIFGKFALDACASKRNAKCRKFISEKEDALKVPWKKGKAGLVWCNPPYDQAAAFLDKAASERLNGISSVLLIASRTDTRAWHSLVMQHANTVYLIKGRVYFKGAKTGAPFPSALVYFQAGRHCLSDPYFKSLKLTPEERGKE